ncbi:MAG TPA: tetratricopeptide repeat protein [Bacteroidetes bacterium]|nr:tetratricopeptide repeat protein [Bacteroidota bacterium]
MSRSARTLVLFLFLLPAGLRGKNTPPQADTTLINRQTREAYSISRKDPDLAILTAWRALSVSEEEGYTRGMADASLALGMAYLARFRSGDSAFHYNHRALKFYTQTGDLTGMGRACYALSYVHNIRGDPDSSEVYSQCSLDYFTRAGDKRGMVNAISTLTYLTKQKGNLQRARELAQEAIETARSIPDTLLLADALNNLGNIYKDMALFNHAIDSYFEALELWEQKGDSTGLSIAYGSIGLMFYYQKEFGMALDYYRKKLAITGKTNDLWEKSKTLNNMALIHNERKQYDSSLVCLQESLLLNERMNYRSGIANAYYNLANTLLLMTRIDSANRCITRAVTMAREINDPSLPDYLLVLSQVHRAKKDYRAALGHVREAYLLAGDQNKPLLRAQAAILLSDLYSLTGRKDLAYGYLKEYNQINDSISSNELLNRINRMEIEYEYRRKEEAAEYARMQERTASENRIRQQGMYLKGLIILIILLGVISLLYFRHSRIKARYEKVDLEQRLLRAQMNPHFIFNSLCAVQEMILEGRPAEAQVFLARIARLMRNILENTMEEYIPLEKEIETLRLYLEVQEMRFDPGFDYTLQVEETIDPVNYCVPPMLAQPCVENAIEHGLRSLQGKGRLNISYRLKNGFMVLEVEDNGVGRKAAGENRQGNIGKEPVSTRLTRKRLEYYRKTLRKRQIGFRIIDLYENDRAAGTRVVMKLPYRKIFS